MLGWFKKKKQQRTADHGGEKNQENLVPLPSQGQSHPDSTAGKQPLSQDPKQEYDGDGAPEGSTNVNDDPGLVPSEPEIVNEGQHSRAGEKGSPSVLERLAQRLSRTRETFTNRIDELFLGKKVIDAELFEELEEILVTADLGIATTQDLLEQARRQIHRDALSDPKELKAIIKDLLKSYISAHEQPAEYALSPDIPFVIMVVGVNGVGKTTTIGKIAKKFQDDGQTVLLVAADTFRAAASSQLKIWGERNNVRVISQQEGADPSAVVFDGIAVAVSKQYDVVLVDTAGRLHTKANLMEELKKIKRVMGKQLEGAPHEVLLVIDATTGQNGISQALLFNEAVGVSGIALTKLDGTAKGGIIVNIANELKLPIRFIGVGEQIGDLREFDAQEFIEALFEA